MNSAAWHSRLLASALERYVTFPLYQDTPERSLFKKLGVSQGHILVYDRCGRLTYHLTPSDSKISERYIEVAVFSTLQHNPCGPCCNITELAVYRGADVSTSSAPSVTTPETNVVTELLTGFFNWFIHRLSDSQDLTTPLTSPNINSNAPSLSKSRHDTAVECNKQKIAQRRERQMNKIRDRFQRE